MVWCSHCFNDCLTEFDPENGYISCTDCGKILDDVEYYDGQDEGDAPFSAKDTLDTGGYESRNSEGSKGPGDGPEITRYQAADRPDYSKTHVLSDTSSDEEDNLSDIDDAEVNGYLHNEKEMCYKTMIWEAMNKEYLKEKATNVAVAAVAKKSDASKNLTKERKRRGSDIAPGRSASEATDKVVDRKRQSSKINYEALNKLIPAGAEKKPRTESYTVNADGIQTGAEAHKNTKSYTVDADDIQTGVEANKNVFYSAVKGDEAVNYEDDDYGHYWDPHANNEEFD